MCILNAVFNINFYWLLYVPNTTLFYIGAYAAQNPALNFFLACLSALNVPTCFATQNHSALCRQAALYNTKRKKQSKERETLLT